MKIVCLDLSTHAGLAAFEGEVGERPSLLSQRTVHLGKIVHEFGKYPWCYHAAATEMALLLATAVSDALGDYVTPDVIVVEEINLGRNRYTQKLLENIHTAMLMQISLHWPAAKVVYLDSSEWRSNLGLKMTKEQKKANAKLSKAKRAAADGGPKLDKKKLGVRGKVTAKHLAVAHANATYGLSLKVKDNDAADAICLGLAYCNNATPCDGV